MSGESAAPRGRVQKVLDGAQVFYHWKKGTLELPYLPLEISIEPTNRCNFACHFCPQSLPTHFDRIPATALHPEGVAALLQKLRDGGVETNVLHWTLDGEPFMNKRFHELIETAVGFGFNAFHFATNGMLASPERLHQFPSTGQSYFLTPDFCSDEAYFEDVRGTKGSWAKIRDNLNGILSDPELAHVNLEINDISSFKFHDEEDLARRHVALKALFPNNGRVTFYRRRFHNAAGTMEVEGQKKAGYSVCPYPWYSMIIANNGDVVACCRDLEHMTVLGNLFKQNVQEIWNGKKYQALRRDLLEEHPEKQAACNGCDLPYDSDKFSISYMVKTAVNRLLILKK